MYRDNEDLIGAWFKRNPEARENIFLATKFANVVSEDGTRSIDSTPEYAKKACEKSLKRLGVKNVDLYYCHRLDGKVSTLYCLGLPARVYFANAFYR